MRRYACQETAPSAGGSCGGYTVAFGPLGDLKLNMNENGSSVRKRVKGTIEARRGNGKCVSGSTVR